MIVLKCANKTGEFFQILGFSMISNDRDVGRVTPCYEEVNDEIRR